MTTLSMSARLCTEKASGVMTLYTHTLLDFCQKLEISRRVKMPNEFIQSGLNCYPFTSAVVLGG